MSDTSTTCHCGASARGAGEYSNVCTQWPLCEQAEADTDLYECPDCGEGHDGMTTGTEYCGNCQTERDERAYAAARDYS